MSRLIAKIRKTIRLGAFLGVLGTTAFLGYEFIQSSDKAAVVESVKTRAETSAQWAAEQTDEGRKVWEQLAVERKVDDFQDKTKPIGRKITSVVTPNFKPIEEGERRMSMPALLLILVFGFVFVLMGRASTGGGRY